MSMVKVISPSGWDWDRPVVMPIRVSSRGLIGNDRKEFLKVASHVFLPHVQELSEKMGKDLEPVHLISHGATEIWGANRNGDGFKHACCERYHPTFEKFAHWHRNHKNKPAEGDPYYGLIKKAAYSDAMKRVELMVGLFKTKEAAEKHGKNAFVADKELEKLASGSDLPVSMACSKAGTLIYTDKGFKPIEQIEQRDLVLTHRGRFRPVGNRSVSQASSIVQIRPRYYGRQVLEFTPNHEFYVARWEDLPKGSHRDSAPSRFFRAKYREQLYTVAKWLPCSELRAGDVMLVPIRHGRHAQTISREEARLLGYYLAEGSLIDNTSKGVCFTCNWNDVLVNEIDDLVQPHVTVCRRQHSSSDAAVSVEVYSSELFDICVNGVGRRVANKKVPQSIWDGTAELQLHFVSAWFNGDGWQDVKGLHWSTSSRSLSLELQNLLAAVGVPASVYRIDHTSDLPGGVRRDKPGVEYTVNVSNRYSGMFAGKCKAVTWEMSAVKTTVFITGGYLAIEVGSVKTVQDSCTVYNFSVDDDETYTAFGLATHNCRVPYDQCSYCGNKARTRDDYCTPSMCKAGGCKDNLTRVVKVAGDVHQLHVDNPHPTWFDISSVFRPADRTAYGARADYLTKAASANFDGLFGVSSAKLAEDLGVSAPMAVILDQDDSLLPGAFSLAISAQVKLAHGLDALEKRPEIRVSEQVKRAFDERLQGEFDLSELGEPGTRKCAEALSALAEQKVILPLKDFARFVKKAELADQARSLIPGVYGRMIRDGSLERRLTHGPYVFSTKTASLRTRKWAACAVSGFSLEKSAVDYRCKLSAVRDYSLPKTSFEKVASFSPDAEELARDYACYKVAALERIAAFDDEFMLTTLLSSVQNQVK